ncbi:imidazolonepropionase [Bacillus testis]|uniref:imidazolonepropionase n=1 Tax=Bacillus testis TaxID=1622072 RepID=UPI00067F4FA0|nr:imidazolonepropionase [Bacillus testis]
MHDTLVMNIGELLLPMKSPVPLKGERMKELAVKRRAAFAVKDGHVSWIGADDPAFFPDAAETIDVGGKVVSPGLVDCHTHLVHGGSRENELALKQSGLDYLEILKQGGGILSTVKATREAGADELFEKAAKHLRRMMSHGTTTVESKSGYGLDRETELKQLLVAKRLSEHFPLRMVSTFLGPHALPPAFSGKEDDFIAYMCRLAAEVADKKLASFADIFCEHGVFTTEQAKTFLQHAKACGLGVKIHCDEIVSLGGTELAVELNAASADHAVAASDRAIGLLAQSETVAVLLPGTTFYLGKNEYARARTIIDCGGAVALATDFNPGSCVTENLQMIMSLAALRLKMTAEEIWNAVTVNAAHAIGLGESAGSLAIGAQADFVVWDIPNYAYLPYHFAVNHADAVYIKGKRILDC